MLTGKHAQLAAAYWLTGSVKFGSYPLAAHRENPDLPPSPIYLHYPKPGEPGAEYLPQLFAVADELLADLLMGEYARLMFNCMAAVPDGAVPLLGPRLNRLRSSERKLEFRKYLDGDGQTAFSLATKVLPPFAEFLLAIDDHLSGGYNKRKFIEAAKAAGLTTVAFMVLIDREQGGREFLESQGIKLISVMTVSELLEYYRHHGYISPDTYTKAADYVAANNCGRQVRPANNQPLGTGPRGWLLLF